MATLIKKIGPEIPLLESYQTFTGYTEFASDDIIDVQASLGRPASTTFYQDEWCDPKVKMFAAY